MLDSIPMNGDILLTTMTMDDIPDLVEAMSDKLISDYTLTIPYPYSPDDALQFLNLIEARIAEAGYITNWMVKKSGKVIGGIGLVCQEGYHSHRSEFGYWITANYRSQGITTAVIKTFTKFVFDELPFSRLEAHTFCENIASQKVLEKNGFLREGHHRHYIKKGNSYKDVYSYSKLHPDF